MAFNSVLDLHSIDTKEIEGAIISSVVPPVAGTLVSAVTKFIGVSRILSAPA